MGLPVRRVLRRQVRRADHQQILGVVLLGVLGKVEAAGDDRRPVDDHDLVVRDGVLGVDPHGDADVHQEVGFAVLLCPLALIEDAFSPMSNTMMTESTL